MVSNDTGIRNLAITCDTTTVGIFFASYPFRYWPRHGNHDIVIPDGEGMPSVSEAFDTCNSALERISATQTS